MYRPPARSGFTLVELLIVIVVIGILIGLLLPAIMGGLRTANTARVAGEIQSLSQALQSFKTKYGDFPPSAIWACEDGGYAPTLMATRLGRALTPWEEQVRQRSVRYLRKFFPQVALTTSGAAPGGATFFYDFNGTGTWNDQPYLISGHECLVFFLGGIPNGMRDASGKVNGVSGFASNPKNPFQNEARAPGGRTAPFFDFRADRLIDDDNDNMPGYIDPLGVGTDGRYYVYFSAYGGNAYDPDDVNFAEPDDDTGTPTIARHFGVQGATVNSPAPNPYTSSDPIVPAASSGALKYINPDSYQIISAGRDRLFGIGGRYLSTGTGDRLPFGALDAGSITPPGNTNIRVRERDNVTNFSQGTLE